MALNLYELAKQIVCSIIAVALNTTATVVRHAIPFRPDWLERVAVLARYFEAAAAGEQDQSPASPGPAPSAEDVPDERAKASPVDVSADIVPQMQALLAAYQELWQFSQEVKTRGLAMDDAFCERVEKEWSVKTLLSYMRSAEKAMQQNAEEAQAGARAILFTEDDGKAASP